MDFKKVWVFALLLCSPASVFSQSEDYSSWSNARLIRINTTASGVNVPGTVTNFPLAVRLNPNGYLLVADAGISSGNLDVLLQTRPAGEDLRFCRLLANGNLGPALPYEIERWNKPGVLQGDIWVRVDTVFGNNASQSIVMFWGKTSATSRSSGANVFDAETYSGVWHLGNLTGNSAGTYAARPNAVAGGSVALPDGGNPSTGFPQRPGIMGLSDTLRGGADTNRATHDHLDLGSGYSDFSNGLTMSLWIKPARPLLSNWNVLMALGNGAPKDNLTVGRNGSTRGIFGEIYNNTTGAGRTEITDTLVYNQWQWVTFTVKGTLQTLYYNGGNVVSTRNAAVTIPTVTRAMAYVGRSLWADPGFAGAVDEVRIHKTARSADWIRLEYETQKSGSTGLTFVNAPAIPELSAPAANATGVAALASLSWSAVSGGSTYQVQMATNSLFTSSLIDTLMALRTLAPGPLAFNTRYYWRVRAHGAEAAGPWSEVRAFTTEPAPTTAPVAPVLLAPPLFVSQQSLTTTLVWQESPGATRYRVQVSLVPNFASTVTDDSTVISSPRTAGSLSGNQEYYWRVRGKNTFGAGPWSETWAFTTMTVAPEAPLLALPSPFATSVPLPASLSWNPSAGATTYRVDLSLNSGFTSYAWVDSAVTGVTKSTGNLAGFTEYYWRVRAKNAAGVSPYSETRRFTTGEPVALQPGGLSGQMSGEVSLTQVHLRAGGYLRFDLTTRRQVSAELWDAQGKRLAVLWEGTLGAGPQQLTLPTGIAEGPHFLKFRAGTFRKTLLLRPE